MMEKYRELAKKIISKANADHVVVRFMGTKEDNTRFGLNRITQNMAKDEVLVDLELHLSKKVGKVAFTLRDDLSLDEVLRRAREIAENNVEDPEYVPPTEKVEIPVLSRRFESTESLEPKKKAEMLKSIFDDAKKHDLVVAGTFFNGYYDAGIFNSNGLEAYYESSYAIFSITAQTSTSSGYASDYNEDFSKMDPVFIYEVAKEKAIKGQNPKALEPGLYDVILEPLAVRDLLGFMLFEMDARSADEGRSFFAGKVKSKVFDERINLLTDPYSEVNPSMPFDDNGVPIEKIYWVRNGVVENLYYDRYWALKNNRKPTGRPYSVILEEGKLTVDELVKKVERGLLVTRFWYIRFVDRKSITVTGMTRDGVFYIENGEIKYPVKNFRFNESPARVLASVIELGKGKRVVGSEFEWPSFVPSLLVKDFNFSSKTEF